MKVPPAANIIGNVRAASALPLLEVPEFEDPHTREAAREERRV
jgi:hypothetical protein